jgi:hypothetical protein
MNDAKQDGIKNSRSAINSLPGLSRRWKTPEFIRKKSP